MTWVPSDACASWACIKKTGVVYMIYTYGIVGVSNHALFKCWSFRLRKGVKFTVVCCENDAMRMIVNTQYYENHVDVP